MLRPPLFVTAIHFVSASVLVAAPIHSSNDHRSCQWHIDSVSITRFQPLSKTPLGLRVERLSSPSSTYSIGKSLIINFQRISIKSVSTLFFSTCHYKFQSFHKKRCTWKTSDSKIQDTGDRVTRTILRRPCSDRYVLPTKRLEFIRCETEHPRSGGRMESIEGFHSPPHHWTWVISHGSWPFGKSPSLLA